MELLILLLIVVLFDLAAMRWGYDSSESLNSPEWEKRLAPPFVGKSQTLLGYDNSLWNGRKSWPFQFVSYR